MKIAYLAQTPQIHPPQSPTDLTAWGVLGLIALFAVREGIAIFRQQNNQETTIIQRLMARQEEREALMEQRHDKVLIEIKEILAKTSATIAQQQITINELSKLQYNQTRSYAENLMGIRSELKTQNAVLTELLRRSDRQLGIESIQKIANGKSN